MGRVVTRRGAAAVETALLATDKINMKPKPKRSHEICIFPKDAGHVYLQRCTLWGIQHGNPPAGLFSIILTKAMVSKLYVLYKQGAYIHMWKPSLW